MNFEKSETIGALAAALAKAQAEVMAAHKDSQNPFFKSTYADLESVWDACRGPLSKNGLSVVQLPHFNGEVVSVTTVLMHASGEWISGELGVRPAKADAQGVGATTTYLRRFCLQSVVGVCPTDDDGNEASGRTQPPQVYQPAKPARKPTASAKAPLPDEALEEERAAVEAGFTSLQEAKNMRSYAFQTALRNGWTEKSIKQAVAENFNGRGFRGLTKDELQEATMLCERRPPKAPKAEHSQQPGGTTTEV